MLLISGLWGRWFRTIRILAAAIITLQTVSACAIVDQYGSRAVQYNDEAAVTKSSMILLNILRAAHAEPLQFSDMTTVAGTSTLSGTASGTLPVYLNTIASLAARSASVTPSGTATGSATVNVANLNNQEFYKGLQTPLTMQQVAYYVLNAPNGLSASQLLPLFIAEIEVTSVDRKRKAVLRNNARSTDTFMAFYSALNELIINGLHVEPLGRKPAVNVGPALSEAEVRNPEFLAAIVAAEGAVAAGGVADASGLTLKMLKDQSSGSAVTTYQLQKDGGGGGFRFCFAEMYQPNTNVDFSLISRPKLDPMVMHLGVSNGAPVAPLTVAIGSAYYCGAKSQPSGPSSSHQTAGQGVKISTRSLEGIFFYLGEIVRAELGLANNEAGPLLIPMPKGNQMEYLHFFGVERRWPTGGEPSATYRGQTFAINVDPSGTRDTSSRILQLLVDLTALQSAAKNLPAPNFIAITSQ
jgi:hypothetical protein